MDVRRVVYNVKEVRFVTNGMVGLGCMYIPETDGARRINIGMEQRRDELALWGLRSHEEPTTRGGTQMDRE